MPRSQLLGMRREAQEGVDLPLREEFQRIDRGVGDPMEIVARVETDLASHQRKQRGVVRCDPLALELADNDEYPAERTVRSNRRGRRRPGQSVRRRRYPE